MLRRGLRLQRQQHQAPVLVSSWRMAAPDLEEAIIEMEANHSAPGVHDSNLPILHRPPHPVLHIPAGPGDQLTCTHHGH